MNTPLHCTDYDLHLQASLNHLMSYPQYLPFIGNAWANQTNRVLFIAESHYFHEKSNGKSNSQTWYVENASNLHPEELNWTDTRGVVERADKGKFRSKGLSIFYNLKSAIESTLEIKNSKETMFQNFGYYNYFQRPAEVSGKSIRNMNIDNEIAYQTLTAICEHAKPTVIIFVSSRAKNSFDSVHKRLNLMQFDSSHIYQVPHPACAWWNRKSKSFSKTGEAISGKRKFMNIIKELDLKLV